MAVYSIGFCGDVTTGENYHLRSEAEARINVLRQHGYEWLFEKVDPLLSRFDMNIFNLETPLTFAKNSSLQYKKACIHWADPNIVPNLLKKRKVEACTLGNNHGLDYDTEGLKDTIEALDKCAISHFGADMDEETAKIPYKKTINIGSKQVNLYVLGGYKYKKEYEVEFDFYAKGKKAGVNLLTDKTAYPIISEIRQNDKDALIVVFPHFGFDILKTTKLQRDYAHGFIDAGADYVIGHGPHMMNSMEIYKGKPILHGIGNFIFPTNFRATVVPYNMAAELRLTEDENGFSHKLFVYPVYSDNQSYEPQVRPIKEEETSEFLSLLCEDTPELIKTLDVQNVDSLICVGI